MNEIHDAKPNDIYVDADGKLWRVLGVCGEPTVLVEEIEKQQPYEPVQKHGGISGWMWEGFKRIYRHEAKPMPVENF